MANLLVDFTKGFASTVAPQSLSDLKSDAEEIYSSIIGGAKTAQDKYREITRSPMFRKVSGFFTRRGDEFSEGSTLEDDSDDFDAGFRFGGDDEEKSESKLLDSDSMKSIARGQVSSMYQIAGKQAEASAMNASEIITTINTRSSEILSSLGSINSSLQSITQKLDKIIELSTPKKETDRSRKYNGLYDSSGNLTLGRTFDYLKENLPYKSDFEIAKTAFGMLPMMFQMGGSKAETFGSIAGLLSGIIEDKRFGILGDRSINDIRDAIDERVNNATNSILTKLLDWSKFKNLFGDLTRRESNKDYSSEIQNQYNRDKATFDNMTRKTIIDIIPGYLRRITAALTGENLYVSSEGSLTTQRESGFKNVFNSTITSGFNDKRMKEIMNRAKDDIKQEDVYMAQRVLVSLYVFHELRTGQRTQGDMFENGGDPETNMRAITMLSQKSENKQPGYWERVIQLLTTQLISDKASRNKFAQIIRSTADSSDRRAVNYAQTATITYDIKAIDDDLVNEVVGGYIERTSGKDDRTWNERVKAGEIKRSDIPIGVDPDSRASDEALKKAQRERIRQSEAIGNIGVSFREINTSTIDYLSSIFAILNRGINVYAVSNGPFEKMDLIKSGTSQVVNNNTKPELKFVTVPNQPTSETTDTSSTDTQGQDTTTSQQSTYNATTPASTGSSVISDFVKTFISNPVNKIKQNIATDLTTLKAMTFDSANIEYNKAMAKRQSDKLGDSESDKQDKAIADAVLAAMNAATADGDTQEDLGPLMSQISEIKDPKLKSRLTKVVEGTLQRSENKKPAQSKIGKILFWGLGLVKGFVLPVITKAKTFIVSVGKALISPLIKSLKQSGQRIGRGFTAIKEGLFGSDESRGIFGRAKDSVSGFISSKYEKYETQKEEKRIADLKKTLVDINEQPKKQTQQQSDSNEEKKAENILTRAMDKVKEKLKKTEFGQGFLSAFEDKKKAREMTPRSLADQMTKSISDILKSKDGSGSVFGTIISKITSVGDVIKDGIGEIVKKKNDESGSSKSSSMSINQGNPTTGGELPGQNVHGSEQNVAKQINATGQSTVAAAKPKGIGFDLGKILGGITGILGGLLQAVISVIMGMAGFKKIMDLVMSVLKNSLKPLNKAFNALHKALKPVLKTVQKVLRKIVDYIVEIVESVIEIIQPILEIVGPILEQMLDILKPILEQLTGFIQEMAAPMAASMEKTVVPLLVAIGNSLGAILGIVEVGIGVLINTITGGIKILGTLVKIFGGDDTDNIVDQIIGFGDKLIKQGSETIVKQSSKSMNDFKTYFNKFLGKDDEDEKEKTTVVESTGPSERERTVEEINGSPMDGVYGNGDYYSLYGGAGANQNRYGNYMNMGQRGCGPVALADAYSRRSGVPVNARGLTSAMASSGSYSPTMGTSVGGFISASSSMGMNLRAGGVTPASLKQASPHNPITIIGSGSDFTTRNGNNHYMNVIGSSGGTAYVSNPMNGRIERRSVTSLAANSVLGLYGAGDSIPERRKKKRLARIFGSGDAGFQFSDEVQDALTNLKEIVSSIIGLFTGEDSIESSLEKAKQNEEYKAAMRDTGDLSDEEKQKMEEEAFELYKKDNPKFKGETDADYKKRFMSDQYYKPYMTRAAAARVKAEVDKTAGGEEGTTTWLINQTLGELDPETGERKGGFTNGLYDSLKSYGSDIEKGSFFTQLQEMVGDGYWDEIDGESGFYSDNGARLYTDEYDPTVFDTSDAVNWRQSKGDVFDAPLMEWFQNMMPTIKGMSSAYKRYSAPANEEVEGQSGNSHSGTDIYDGGAGTEIIATTDGVVTATGYDPSAGNFVNIEDVGGDLHQYFHMKDGSIMVEKGDEVYGGDPIGIMGSTGHSTGPHLHYQIKSGDDGTILNPWTFFKWYEGSGASAPYGEIDFEGDLESGNAWPRYKDQTGVSKFMKTAFEAGLTGPEVATITSTGIWEDGAKKLWGDKSLLNTTYDVNGQRAQGIMNWVDPNVDYGDTVEEQLQYIQRVYFDDDSDDFRAKVRKTGYEDADLAGYKKATGRSGWKLDFGDPYGPYMNDEDLIEGSEHFFRGALVPQCIHTDEGPRKYIGTAVGVYNWLLDEGYISEDDGKSRVWRRYDDDDDYYDDSDLTVDIVEDTSSQTAAKSSAKSSAQQNIDKESGVVWQYTTLQGGSNGTAKNKAGVSLFDYYVPSGNTNTDKYAFFDKHKNYWKFIATSAGSGSKQIYIYKFYTGTAGMNAKAIVSGSKPKQTNTNTNTSPSSGTSAISTGPISTNDMVLIWKSAFAGNHVPAYVKNKNRTDMIYDFNGKGALATKNGQVVKYDTKNGQFYYKDHKDAGWVRVVNGKVYWPEIKMTTVTPTYTNTNTTTTTTDTTDAFKTQSYMNQLSQYVSSINGGGDASTIIPTANTINDTLTTGIMDLFTNTDTGYAQTSSPVIVNKYDIPTTNNDALTALMTNTYNIRSEQIESMLTSMLAMMKERNQQRERKSILSKTRSNKKESLFSEQGIPQQITRLSVG